MKRARIPIGSITLALAVIAGALISGPHPAGAATVAGVTRDAETQEPLGFVTVQIRGRTQQGGELSRGVMSDDQGVYALVSIPLGRYEIRFTRIGYLDYTDSLRVDRDTEYTVSVRMTVQPVEVEEIVVEADRFQGVEDVQPSFVNLDPDNLANLPSIIEADPIKTLQLLPGVQAASEFSSGLYVRGGGPDQTLVLLDQVTIYNPTHAFGFFSSFNSDALNEVNLYKGAYPAQHGGRLGAVLEVGTKEGNRDELKGRAGISTIASRLALDGPINKNGTWMVSARRTHLDPLLDAIRSQGEDVPSYFFYDINAKLAYQLAGGRLVASVYRGSDDLKLEFDADSDIRLNWGNTLASLSYKRPVGEKLLANAQVSWSRYKSESAIRALTTPISFGNEIRDFSARWELVWALADRHKLKVGMLATQFDVRYNQVFNLESNIDYKRSPYEGSAFIEDTWTPLRRTIIQAGLRSRYLEDGARWLWEPRLSMSQGLNDRVRLKLAGGVYHQYLQLIATEGLSATDFYVPIDDTAYPGRAVQVVGGVEFDPSPGYRTSVEVYYTDLENLVTFNTRNAAGEELVTAADIFYTDGTGYATGVELFVRKQLGDLTGWVGYTLGWTRRTFSELNRGDEFPPKYDRRHDVNVVGQYQRGKWRYGASFILASGQAFTPAAARYWIPNPATGGLPESSQVLPAERNSARLLPYHRLDVNVSRSFSMFGLPAEWSVQIFNVYSRRNEWFVQYNTEDEIIDADVVKMLPIIPSLGLNFRF